jgi:hypothetical protein
MGPVGSHKSPQLDRSQISARPGSFGAVIVRPSASQVPDRRRAVSTPSSGWHSRFGQAAPPAQVVGEIPDELAMDDLFLGMVGEQTVRRMQL